MHGYPRNSLRWGHCLAPERGEGTATVLDGAVEALGRSRGLWPGDASAVLQLLANLAAEVTSRLPSAVADAKAYGLSWAEVADLLGVTRASAWEH